MDPHQLLTAFFSSSTVGFALMDDQLRFQAINPKLAEMNGAPVEDHIGKSLREILGDVSERIEAELRKVLETGEPVVNLELSLQLRTRSEIGHWMENYFPIKDGGGRVKQIGAIVVEVTEQRRLEQSLHQLTGRLLHVQDDQQRRIARDLHDSINQYHAALKMNLARLDRQRSETLNRDLLVKQSLELVESCISETRTLSHLLHPPLLEEMGFFSAVSWYVKGFGQRSGIKTNLTLPSDLSRLPAVMERALFRVVQEALTNVHRHAKTRAVDIHMERTESSMYLTVRDYGCGMLPEKLREVQQGARYASLGIASMHERVLQLGGEFSISSDSKGTLVSAKVPIREAFQLEDLSGAKYA